MKILFLTADFPYPVVNGSRMRTWSFMDALCKEHEVSVMCFRSNDALSLPTDVTQCFERIWIVDSDHFNDQHEEANALTRIGNLIRGVPWEVSTAFSKPFAEKLHALIESHDFDLIFARYVHMGLYLIGSKIPSSIPTIIDIDDIEYKKVERTLSHKAFQNWYAKSRLELNNWLLKKFFGRLRNATINIVCSEEDKKMLMSDCDLNNVRVIQNSIDVKHYGTVGPYDRKAFVSKTLLFCGSLNYAPNTDALDWFCGAILPRIREQEPGVIFRIVGLSRQEALMRSRFRSIANVELNLNVPDVMPYYRDAAVVVIPIRIGGGTRIKALEAMACKRPIVATSVGVEGLGLAEGGYCAIGNSPEEFADACVRLLKDYEAGRKMAQRGAELVTKKYDRCVIQEEIREVCRIAIGATVDHPDGSDDRVQPVRGR